MAQHSPHASIPDRPHASRISPTPADTGNHRSASINTGRLRRYRRSIVAASAENASGYHHDATELRRRRRSADSHSFSLLVRKQGLIAVPRNRSWSHGHDATGESQSSERLSYVGDVAPPTQETTLALHICSQKRPGNAVEFTFEGLVITFPRKHSAQTRADCCYCRYNAHLSEFPKFDLANPNLTVLTRFWQMS